ncbi:hypothetical protein CA11_53110 [Gimesia maris]|uniref:SIR2 family protein n=1 Tax=Gimesia maris TaxID=122 RepID=UPI001189A4CB|nr:SIR2 family protein [Gimesia maris]QDU17469.1 hypothetical protein CA11_53110 [Gimesia maris]
MLEKRTCLILGAGASAHLGFPVGAALKNDILKELKRMITENGLKDYPPEIQDSDEDLNEFYRLLNMGIWDSPDAFLEDHPEFKNTGKYLICKQLAEKEKASNFIDNMGWYQKLMKAIRVNHPDKLKDNELSIITFNYDRSLDYRLHEFVYAHYGIKDADEAWQIVENSIDIIHVHGTLGEYPKYEYGSIENIYERSQKIKIISEVANDAEKRDDGFVNYEFKRASELLHKAERVVVFGFGFAEDNVERLHFFEKKEFEDGTEWKEKRDIIVATGGYLDPVDSHEKREWLKRWGLRRGNQFPHAQGNYFEADTRQIFSKYVNPFPTKIEPK